MPATNSTKSALAAGPQQNKIFAALTAAALERLTPNLELVPMRLGDLLYDAGEKQLYAYFPITSIISMHHELENGGSAEVAGVGNEGFVGIAVLAGGNSTPNRAVVLAGGHGYRLKASALMQEFYRGEAFTHCLLRSTQVLMSQLGQTAVCNRHHPLEKQLCRWLLMTLDRATSNDLTMTQELISNMLGVRREGVTEAAGKLQNKGYISYRRGHITVLNRKGLEADACECYGVVKNEFSRLIEDFQANQPGFKPALTHTGWR